MLKMADLIILREFVSPYILSKGEIYGKEFLTSVTMMGNLQGICGIEGMLEIRQ